MTHEEALQLIEEKQEMIVLQAKIITKQNEEIRELKKLLQRFKGEVRELSNRLSFIEEQP